MRPCTHCWHLFSFVFVFFWFWRVAVSIGGFWIFGLPRWLSTPSCGGVVFILAVFRAVSLVLGGCNLSDARSGFRVFERFRQTVENAARIHLRDEIGCSRSIADFVFTSAGVCREYCHAS